MGKDLSQAQGRPKRSMMKSLNQGLILLLPVVVFLSACQPDTGKSLSQVSIRIPTKDEFYKSNKMSAQTAVDYDQLCFAVNVKGGTIPPQNSNCDIEKGILVGSVGSGGTLGVDVPYGDNISFEVYGLLKTGVSAECRKIVDKAWNWPMNKIYQLGKREGVDIRNPEMIVAISVTMPQESRHILAENNFPSTCANSSPAQVNLGRIPGGQIQTGTLFRAYSRVSDSEQNKELVGSQFRIRHMRAVTQ